MTRIAAWLLAAALFSAAGVYAGEPTAPEPNKAEEKKDAEKAKEDKKAADARVMFVTPTIFPTLNVLDFSIERRFGSDKLTDHYNCPEPLNVGGATLSKPVELPIDLPTVFRLAGCDNLDLAFARARLRESHARVLQEKISFLPSVQPLFQNTWFSGREQNSRGEFFNVNKQNNFDGGGIAIDWQLGESIYRLLAERRRAQAKEAGVQVAMDDARFNAVRAFYGLVQTRTDLAISQQRLKEAEQTVKFIEDLAKGVAAKVADVPVAKAERSAAKQKVIAANGKARAASLVLTEILHIDPQVILIPHQESDALVTLVPPEKEQSELIIEGLTRRPELKEQRAMWNAMDKERKGAWVAPLVPRIRIEQKIGSFGQDTADTHHQDELRLRLDWKFGPGGIGDVSATKLAEVNLQKEGIKFAQIADKIAAEVIASYQRVSDTRDMMVESKEEIKYAEEALKLSRDRIDLGAALSMEVINSEEKLFDARTRAAQHVTEYNKAQYELLRAIGGFRDMDFGAQRTCPEGATIIEGK